MGKVISIFTRQEVKEIIPDVEESPEIQAALNDILVVTRTSESLKNKYCNIEYNEAEKSISGNDLTDTYNLPCFYTTRKRNIKKAWTELAKEFNAITTMYDAMDILNKYNLRCHSWDSMD